MKEIKCFLLVLLNVLVATSELCDEKSIPSKNSTMIFQSFCNNSNGVIQARKCNASDVIIGLDLSDCGIKEMIEIPTEIKENLIWIALNDNKFTLKSGIPHLRSALKIQILVTDEVNCTGFEIKTIQNGLTVCSSPLNRCEMTANNSQSYSCLEHSNCGYDGPGLFSCNCDKDWQSYKCLKQDGFPKEKWLISIAATTIAIIIGIRLLQFKARKQGDEYKKLAKLSNTDYANPEGSRQGIFD